MLLITFSLNLKACKTFLAVTFKPLNRHHENLKK